MKEEILFNEKYQCFVFNYGKVKITDNLNKLPR
jgi:hypothetical protein